MINHYSHETFPHFGRLGSHQSNRYYHQDPHYRLFHVASRLDASVFKIDISCYSNDAIGPTRRLVGHQ